MIKCFSLQNQHFLIQNCIILLIFLNIVKINSVFRIIKFQKCIWFIEISKTIINYCNYYIFSNQFKHTRIYFHNNCEDIVQNNNILQSQIHKINILCIQYNINISYKRIYHVGICKTAVISFLIILYLNHYKFIKKFKGFQSIKHLSNI